MNIFYKKHKSLIFIIAFAVIAVPLFYFVAIFLFKNIQNRADRIQEKIIDNNLEKQKIEKIPQMEEINAEFEKNKEAVDAILRASDNVNFIEYIESLAENTGNKIEIKMIDSNLNVKNSTKTTSARSASSSKTKEIEKSLEEKLVYRDYFSMQINLIGDHTKLLNFVHKLENSKNYVNIMEISSKKDVEDKSESSDIELNVGGVFNTPQKLNQKTQPQDENFVLKSSLTVIVYTK